MTEEKATMLFGISTTLIGSGFLFTNFDQGGLGLILLIIGSYGLYRGILELTTEKKGFTMPNAYKIVIAILVLFTANHIASSYVSASFWSNFALNFDSNLDSIVDNLIRIIDYLKHEIPWGVWT